MKIQNKLLPSSTIIDFEIVDPQAPTVIFIHGFKGFKDWGAWSLVQKYFIDNNFNFLKFNFSKNGTDQQNLNDIVRLDLFAQNHIHDQLLEIDHVIAYLDHYFTSEHNTTSKYFLIGHSLGGSLAMLYAAKHSLISKLATWGSPYSLDFVIDKIDKELWKKTGVHYIKNQRTGQELPLNYSIYQDYVQHKKELDILGSLKTFDRPILFLHGNFDETVPFEHAITLFENTTSSTKELNIFPTDHPFSTTHPWRKDKLSRDLEKAVSKTMAFFKESY